MSEILASFATLTFPFGIGAGIQVKPSKDSELEVRGSITSYETYFSVLLWVVELGALILAAIFALLLQGDIELIEDEAITGGDDLAKRLNTNLMLNSIAFVTRAVFVGIVVLVNLSSCSIPAVARTVGDYLFCGNIWDGERGSKGARNTCLMIWFVLEQLVFLGPLLTLVMLTQGNDIGNVLSKSCLQLGMDCDTECALKYSPFATFEETSGHTFTRPVTGLFVMSFALYLIAAAVRLFRNTAVFLCVRTLLGNNATSHNSIGTSKDEVETAIKGAISGASKLNEEVTYSFNADGGPRKRKGNSLLRML